MPAGYRVALAPPNEQDVRGERLISWNARVGDNLNAVRSSIAPFERGRPVVHRDVAAERVGVALRVVCWKELSHQPCRARRALIISFNTFPVRNATLAGRSASRRMRYGYHCV